MKQDKSLIMVALVTLVGIGLLLSATAIARGAIQAVGMFIDTIAG